MRILLLTHSFNSLTQRFFVELTDIGHTISVEFDINDSVTYEAVNLYKPHLIISPYLRRRIPKKIWSNHLCLIVHPGIPGDRGPSSLDWAILNGEQTWGVTFVEAVEKLDAGPIWAWGEFPLRKAPKSSIYRYEVTETAVKCLRQVLKRIQDPTFIPVSPKDNSFQTKGTYHPPMKQSDRVINWTSGTTEKILLSIWSSDGSPGVFDDSLGESYYIYNAWPEAHLRGKPGELLAKKSGAVCRATVDGAVWIGHLSSEGKYGMRGLKLPAVICLGDKVSNLPEISENPFDQNSLNSYREIWYEERSQVGYLHFTFYNGAMSTEQCQRLLNVFKDIKKTQIKVLVLMGGPDFWSNGMHLNLIEAADSPAEESWRNIQAMDNLAEEILFTTDKLIIAAMEGNAGAGGVFLALASDILAVRNGVILNPHYKSMGNLYGSEYWTYLLPKRVGEKNAGAITENRLPISVKKAKRLGLVDRILNGNKEKFQKELTKLAIGYSRDPELGSLLQKKAERLENDNSDKPIEQYRQEELKRIHQNFFGFDPSYHVARYNFVYDIPLSRTPPHLAVHRRLDWQISK